MRYILLIITCFLFLTACDKPVNRKAKSHTEHINTHPSKNYHYIDIDTADIAYEEAVYVPVYSDIYYLDGSRKFALTATLSLRNLNMQDSIYIKEVDYYNSEGELVRQYIKKAIALTPLQTVEIVVPHDDAAGGPGANFIVHWFSKKAVLPLFAQAVMIGTASQQGLSFTTEGIVISK